MSFNNILIVIIYVLSGATLVSAFIGGITLWRNSR